MAIYTGDYELARGFFEEAIRVAPGDAEAYIRLANLHKDYLRSAPETIIGIYDQGIARTPYAADLKAKKDEYVKNQGRYIFAVFNGFDPAFIRGQFLLSLRGAAHHFISPAGWGRGVDFYLVVESGPIAIIRIATLAS